MSDTCESDVGLNRWYREKIPPLDYRRRMAGTVGSYCHRESLPGLHCLGMHS